MIKRVGVVVLNGVTYEEEFEFDEGLSESDMEDILNEWAMDLVASCLTIRFKD